MVKEIGCVAGK